VLSAPLVWALLVAAPPGPAMTLERADLLAATARAERVVARKARAVATALAAYDALIAARPKDRKLVPRLRRRRAGLLVHAKRLRAALTEHDRTLLGPARRKDRARALHDGAVLLARLKEPDEAEARYARVLDEYPDIVRMRAQASLARGRIRQAQGDPKGAERCFRHVVEKCRDETKAVIGAYDALALLEIERGRCDHARRWLERCTRRYAKQATRDDRTGRFVARLLGEMKAPAALAAPDSKGGAAGG